MNIQKKKLMALTLLLAVAAFVVSSVHAEVMSSSNYSIESDSINFGGARSTSTSYVIEDTAGEIATGISTSTSFTLKAGYQQMQEIYLATTPASDVTMSPVIGGVTGGTSNGSTSFSVTTDNAAGYTVDIAAENSPALASADDSFADYSPSGAVPDFTFTNTPANSSFGFSVEGTDIIDGFKDDGADCGVGSSDTADACWNGLSNVTGTIVSRATSNHPVGTLTTLKFRAAAGSARVQANGTYVATTTITILPQ